MNYFSKQDGNKKITILFMVLVFILVSNVNVFAQKTALENNIELNITLASDTTTEINVAKQEAVSNASNMNFVLWFMGSKQTPNATIVPVGTTSKNNL
jgi:hypothetical protein